MIFCWNIPLYGQLLAGYFPLTTLLPGHHPGYFPLTVPASRASQPMGCKVAFQHFSVLELGTGIKQDRQTDEVQHNT